MTTLWTRKASSRGSIPGRNKGFSLLQGVQCLGPINSQSYEYRSCTSNCISSVCIAVTPAGTCLERAHIKRVREVAAGARLKSSTVFGFMVSRKDVHITTKLVRRSFGFQLATDIYTSGRKCKHTNTWLFFRKYFYVGVLICRWLFLFPIFLFATEKKEFFLDGLKKLELRSHKCVELGGGGGVIIILKKILIPVTFLLYSIKKRAYQLFPLKN
jgi:hypothetical protein